MADNVLSGLQARDETVERINDDVAELAQALKARNYIYELDDELAAARRRIGHLQMLTSVSVPATGTRSLAEGIDQVVSQLTNALLDDDADGFMQVQPDPQRVDLNLIDELTKIGASQPADLAAWYSSMLDE